MKCKNCGATDGLHHYQTNQCPVGGREAPLGKKQEYMDTVFEKSVYIPTHDEKLKMVKNMRVYGGGFVSALSEAFIRADGYNLKKLCEAFPEIVETFLNW